MSSLNGDKIDKFNMAEYFDKEIEDWQAKMIKVYADQHPYTFYVTAGHDFEDFMLNLIDVDAPEKQSGKHEPFENLKKMTEVDKEAEKEFLEILSKLENEKPTLDLKEALEEKKKECAKVFEMFDDIVSICEDYIKLEYSDCSKRVSKLIAFQEPVINEVELFLSKVEEFGNAELKSLRDKISKWIYNKSLTILDNINKSYDNLKEQPFAMAVWFECSAVLTSKEVRCAFLADQKEINSSWKKAFDDLLMLSAKLEKCRCNYNLIKFKLEREIFWMNRDYKENMPELTKIQRQLANLIDQKLSLKLELKILENEAKKEQKRIVHAQEKMHRKIVTTKANNKFANRTALKKFYSVLNTRKEELYSSVSEILKGDQFIHEEVLGASWNPADLSHLKLVAIENTSEFEKAETSIATKAKCENADDDFSCAFQVLITSEYFMNLLNMLSDELGYILDFTWVNYIKEKLQLNQEVKWLELFKVFKINFVEELEELKAHMISYCKFADDETVVFDIDGAVDGFLNFVWKKRQSTPSIVLPSLECDLKDCKNYWSSARNLMPKSLLWENVEEVLFQYWVLLETRSNLLKRKLNLLVDNQELENYLLNYHKYGTFCQ